MALINRFTYPHHFLRAEDGRLLVARYTGAQKAEAVFGVDLPPAEATMVEVQIDSPVDSVPNYELHRMEKVPREYVTVTLKFEVRRDRLVAFA